MGSYVNPRSELYEITSERIPNIDCQTEKYEEET